MNEKTITLSKYNWKVRILNDASCADIDTIIRALEEIKCPQHLIVDMANLFKDCSEDNGLCYSSYSNRTTVIVIGNSSSGQEQLNTIMHEVYHFISQLARYNNISTEEGRATIIGDFMMQLKDTIKEALDR